jgi:putative peptidoglycan lipid II flippase
MKANSEGNSGSKVGTQVTVFALMMAFGTFSSRVLGLVRDQMFAAYFSPTVRDAWTAAFRLPNLFRRLLGEGSLSVAFIPVFVQTRVDDPTGQQAKNLVNGFYTLLLIVLACLTAIGCLFPEAFLNVLLDPNYSAVPGKFELTVRMARIMFCFIFFMSTYAYFMGILNSLGKYGLAAMAPTLFNVAMILSNLYPQKWLSSPGDAIAWGVVLGGFLQTVLLVPALYKMGYLPRLTLDVRSPYVRKILLNMLPGMLGLGLLQITTIVNMRFASSLGEGPITYIYLADRLLELPLSLVSVSLGTALLPTLSQLWSEKNVQKMTATANYYLRLNIYVAVPAGLGLFMLSKPMVQLLFQRGQFVAADALATASVVQIYGTILLTSSCVRVLVPSFYAIKNTWLPATVSGICLVVHLFLAPLLMRNFGLQGLVSSAFVTGGINLSLLLVAYRRLIGPFGLAEVFKSLMKFIAAALPMAFVLLSYDFWFESVQGLLGSGTVARFVAVFFTICLAGGVYFLMSYWMGLDEFQTTIQKVLGKIKAKLGRR